MKHRIWSAAFGLAFAAILTVGLAACGDGTVAVESVTLDQTTLSLEVGKTETLTATVAPDDATDKTVTWTTDDAEVATVENGTVTAVAVGEAVITATAGDKTATCSIVVADKVLSTAEDLTAFATAVNGGDTYADQTVALGADIDLTDTAWTPIGNETAFSGTFNGNGYAVKGISLNNKEAPAAHFGGLFVYLTSATVKNVTVEANIETSGWAGILAGRASDSQIIGVTTKGSILGDGAAAAVAGMCEYMYSSTATDCVNEATVTSKNVNDPTGADVSQYAAGIACELNKSSVTNSTNKGAITAKSPMTHMGGTYIGGIAAYMKNGGSLTGNTNTAKVSVTGGIYCEVGGIVGNVFSESEGENKVIGNTNTGAVSATSNDVYVGGIVGAAYAIYSVKIDESSYEYYNNTVTFTGNTNSGAVSMTPAAEDKNGWGYTPCAGGLIGWLEQYSEESFVDDGTNKSSVTPENMTEGRDKVKVKNDYGYQGIYLSESNE